ncbi:ABC transporter ATP-binding protein [Streptomyces malaysiensis]|uniref:ABC transporter ATP-binding protein n=1 Tax=Streptomyces malaysiensis subsp. samsunensis TaxID=459658 RepID=A0A9X2LWZ7_STRMQ|nr:ABC transporter ATP-binding protein [Streptomyces samsunensis]MCQ8831272.1 ABC transporter ATP-binding protein [Streptomyces samsunensis]WPB90708.1 ABC transporter ATP-binding protein [Streptomyces malaysiensis]
MTVRTEAPVAVEVSELTLSGPSGPLVTDVALDVKVGECLGLVGESGSGKTLTVRAIAGLLPRGISQDAGRIDTSDSRVGMVFQDPMRSLNPTFTIRRTMREPLVQHHALSRRAADRRALELLNDVGIKDPQRVADNYPHQLSGGLRQRVLIAAALACDPQILLCDEPTTALDVTTQATILDLLQRLREERELAMLFVSHDLAVISHVSDRVAVMYAGQIVEVGPTSEILRAPHHAYTAGLLRSSPSNGHPDEPLFAIGGTAPQRFGEIVGCRFAARCPWAAPACTAGPVAFARLGDRQTARCVRPDDVAASLSLPAERGGWPRATEVLDADS